MSKRKVLMIISYWCSKYICIGGCKLDVMFVIDSTGSITKDYTNELNYVTQVVGGMTVGDDQQRVITCILKLQQTICESMRLQCRFIDL
jgi:hypothetical protein